jgi:hypothetical protein
MGFISLNAETLLSKAATFVHNGVMYFTFIPLVGITMAMLCVFAFAADESSY